MLKAAIKKGDESPDVENYNPKDFLNDLKKEKRMAKYTLSQKAKDDIADIWEYTYETWSEKQADKYFLLLHKGFDLIATNPKIGLIKQEIDDSLYEFTIHKHMVFYRILSDGIRIVRVFHERMDFTKQLMK